jgi:hypothetical protein
MGHAHAMMVLVNNTQLSSFICQPFFGDILFLVFLPGDILFSLLAWACVCVTRLRDKEDGCQGLIWAKPGAHSIVAALSFEPTSKRLANLYIWCCVVGGGGLPLQLSGSNFTSHAARMQSCQGQRARRGKFELRFHLQHFVWRPKTRFIETVQPPADEVINEPECMCFQDFYPSGRTALCNFAAAKGVGRMTSARQLFLTQDEIRPNSISAAGINCDSHSAISDLAARSQKMSCAHQPQERGRHERKGPVVIMFLFKMFNILALFLLIFFVTR